ncbi:MAG: glycosyltransferase family 9 protein [Lentimicrobium sp.]|jgi:ADP-heptose:LPS heptosyltransferase|nr:glycosyltransferase family 9 protein [Lentimicrobium sp.]
MTIKILVIRFSSIGDIVLTSPVIRCLHEQVEGSEIHFLTKKAFVGITENNPHIHKVYSINKYVSEITSELQAEQYDYIVDLHNNLRSWQVIAKLRKPYRRFTKLNLRKWILVRFKQNFLPNTHIVDRYFDAARAFGVKNDGLGLDFFILPSEQVSLNDLPSPFCNGYVGLVIGGKHHTKILAAERVIDICRLLHLPVILLGGPEDKERGEQIASTKGINALNACGKYNLMQSASLVRQAKAIITNDTGLMHIAAAFQKPIVSVWGNTIPDFGMYPYLPAGKKQFMSEVKNLSCRPCSKIGFEKCPKGHFKCMLDQDVDAIAKYVNAHV